MPGVTDAPSDTPGAKSYWPQDGLGWTDGTHAAYGDSTYSDVNLRHGQSVNIGNGGLYLHGNNALNGNIGSADKPEPAEGTNGVIGGNSRSGIIVWGGITSLSGGVAHIGDLIANSNAAININNGEKLTSDWGANGSGTIQVGTERGGGVSVINISGVGTVVDAGVGSIQVGSDGNTGVINVSNGATLRGETDIKNSRASWSNIGVNGKGAINVTGVNTSYDIGQSGILVGYGYQGSGVGMLQATDGATINIEAHDPNYKGGSDPYDPIYGLQIGVAYSDSDKAEGSVVIGSRATFNVGYGNEVLIGDSGTGNLIIDDGVVNIGTRGNVAPQKTADIIAGADKGDGHIVVMNNGILNVADGTKISLGVSSGVGTLDIANRGTVAIGSSGITIRADQNGGSSSVTLGQSGIWKEAGDIDGYGKINYEGGTLKSSGNGFSIGQHISQSLKDGTWTTVSPGQGTIVDNGVISGAGNLIVANNKKDIITTDTDTSFLQDRSANSTFTTNAKNTYTGATIVGPGVTLDIGKDGSIASSNYVEVLGGSTSSSELATVKFEATDNSLQRLAGNGNIDIDDGNGTLNIIKELDLGAPTETEGVYGHLKASGSFGMEEGSQLNANLGPNLQSSQMTTTGAFKIGSNTDFDIQANHGAALTVGQKYEIVHADKGVSGKFTHYNQNGKIGGSGVYDYGVLWTAGPDYSSNDVTITLLIDKSKGLGWGGDRNQTTTGDSLTSSAGAPGGVSGLAQIVAGLDNQDRLKSLNKLDGEINADSRTAMINDAFYIRDAAIGRLDCAGDLLRQRALGKKGRAAGYCGIDNAHAITTWGTVYGSNGGNSGHHGYQTAAHMSDSSVGWIMGADTLVGSNGNGLGQWRLGGLIAYGRNMFGVSGRSSSGSSNNVSIGAYGGTSYHVGGLAKDAVISLKLGASYSWDIIHTHRNNISFANFSDHTSASQLGGAGQLFGEMGYKFMKSAFEIEPFARMTYMNYREGSFKERGGLAALEGKAKDSSLGFSTVGTKFATMFNLGKVAVSPHATLAYRRAFGKINSTVHERFRAARNSSYDMSVIGTPVSQDTALLETGFSAQLIDRLSIDLNYIGQYGTHITTSGGTGAFRLSF